MAKAQERRIALVTDSTASLTPSEASELGVVVVPVQVIIGATVYDDGMATPDMVATALKEWTPVSTSRPNPATFVEAYEKAAAAGATEVLSIHLSGELSGTVESARLAAREVSARGIKVTVLDSEQSAFALGYAVRAAAEVVAAGGSVRKAVNAAKRSIEGSQTIFYVDTLEYLRRGGRVSAVGAFLGGALAVKPLLRFHEGRIESFEKVRTAGKALARVEELAVSHAHALGEDVRVHVTVGHLASPDRAKVLAEKIAHRLGDQLADEVHVGELGAVLGAHVGPGMIAAVVVPAS
ncbi:DegV family protein [Nocardioides jiangxiensis]|uniref:DegV family protein n=1 Tax=Nocardioides jiangxiensis TaxID=3064524 RepID=A0ABT9B0R3_9ACTN|nr:DegV family protein [Nocardioides sp. WY-20]MDO7867212.1 DegV family protein [Nocardioides sp. WY-20]